MDKLDKLSLLAIILLIASTSFLVAVYADDSLKGEKTQILRQVRVVSPELAKKVEVARNLLENNNLPKAAELARTLIKEYPYDGGPYMILGDVELRQQDPVAAMDSFRSGIDLNPDYLDKKTKVFQGKKIKATVLEAKAVIEKDLRKNPGNSELKQKRKTVYYMLRRIAGSCG
jgi:tetratricopeptide (TPR) repeat protein